MASDIDYKKQYEESVQRGAELLDAYTKVVTQQKAQRTRTILLAMGAALTGAAAGYVAGVLRLGR